MYQYPGSVTAEKGGGALVVSLDTSGTRALAWAEVGRDAVPGGESIRNGFPHVHPDCDWLISGPALDREEERREVTCHK